MFLIIPSVDQPIIPVTALLSLTYNPKLMGQGRDFSGGGALESGTGGGLSSRSSGRNCGGGCGISLSKGAHD